MAYIKKPKIVLNPPNSNNKVPDESIISDGGCVNIEYEEWAKFLSYYRYYIDRFAIDILGVNLFPFQQLMLRAMNQRRESMLICCRGLTKSYISAIFAICRGILYPNCKIGITSGVFQQAKNVVIQKIKGELEKQVEIEREIKCIKSSGEDCICELQNGSEIRAFCLNQGRGGNSARSWRFQIVIVDEARLVKDSIIEEILIPMTKTPRSNIINMQHKYPNEIFNEQGKMIYLSSAYLKTCDLYKRFLFHYKKMQEGSNDYFVCALDYKVGIKAKILTEHDVISEKEKPTMTLEKFAYEFNGVFVGNSGDSYFPYELTQKCRTLQHCELIQPKKSTSRYILTQDIAVSGAYNSDNTVIHIIKLKPCPNGSFIKEVVYSKTMNGWTLIDQRNFVRDLVHIKFPNIEKILIDGISLGAGYIALFCETWEYIDDNNNKTEYPPLIRDDDREIAKTIPNAVPMIRSMEAYGSFNNGAYTYTKSCFEDGSLRLLYPSVDMDIEYKMENITAEQQNQYIEHDILLQELSNIIQVMGESGRILFSRSVKTTKRDRATSLVYGLYYVMSLELEAKANLYDRVGNDMDYFNKLLGFQ